MGYKNTVRDGRQSKVYLLKFGTTVVTTLTTTDIGKIFSITKKDSSASAFEKLRVGDFFICLDIGTGTPHVPAVVALGSGDELVEVTPLFLGGATDKDLSFEKTTQAVTCDKDAAEVTVTSGVVAISGSITAYDLIETGDTAANRIRQRFDRMVTYDLSTGKPIVNELDRTEKDVLMFVWDARELDEGEYVTINFVPALLTSQGHNSAYSSGQTFPVNFSGSDSDDHGHKRSFLQFPYFKKFGDQMEAWDAN